MSGNRMLFGYCLAAAVLIIPSLPGDLRAAALAAADAGDARGAAAASLEPLERGVLVRTPSYEVEIVNGAATRLYNVLTREEYIVRTTDGVWRRELPGGLATQHGDAARQAAAKLHTWPWMDHVAEAARPNQHIPDGASVFTLEQPATNAVVLTYRDLTDGKDRYPDETFRIRVEVDAATGDLLLTPSAESPRPGVYGVCLQVGRLLPAISVEAPIWDGMRITSDMPACLWHNQWPSFWDFQFLAINGQERGAFGVWAQDGNFDFYKSLFFMVKDRGISLSMESFATPPFDKLTSVTGATWRVQAFDKHWAQAAARYRAWREGPGGIAFAPRPAWTRNVSCMGQSNRPNDQDLKPLKDAWGDLTDRMVLFSPIVRNQGFDKNHWDNRPFPEFKSNMVSWKAQSGPACISYIQPMIMWGGENARTEEQKQIVRWASEANTIAPFHDGKPQWFVDQHHLGYGPWQRWFLDGVKHWIQDCGTRGIYHDQSYLCPVDDRGLVNGMNSVQGMADYFRKVNLENPDTIHGTEHLQEANLTGCSLGIGPMTLWGTEPAMRMQRIRHPSPVSAALQYPYAVSWEFSHDREPAGAATIVHWQLGMVENRALIPRYPLQRQPVDAAEPLVDAIRAETFIRLGLRPVFPADWDPAVRTYYRGAQGEDLRYEVFGPALGSRFVRVESNGTRRVLYTRINGVRHATVSGAIPGWPCYHPGGPSGLNPERYYVVAPDAARPAAWVEPVFRAVPTVEPLPHLYGSYIEDAGVNDHILWLRLSSLYPRLGARTLAEQLLLHAPQKPVAAFVDGKPVPLADGPATNTWAFSIGGQSMLTVILQAPPTRDPDARSVLARHANDFGCDRSVPAVLATQVKGPGTNAVRSLKIPGDARMYAHCRTQVHALFGGSPDQPDVLELVELPKACEVLVNGAARTPTAGSLSIPIGTNAATLVSVSRTTGGESWQAWQALDLKWRWTPAATNAPVAPKP